MELGSFNGLNIIYNKQYELILGVLAVYLRKHQELKDDKLDWIEVPNIKYMDELEKIIDFVSHDDLIEMLLNFKDESSAIDIAICLDENYDVIDSKIDHDSIDKYVGKEELYVFAKKLKEYANKIDWDSFFDNHKNFYKNITADFCAFPSNLDLNDLINFYGVNERKYYYIPSILMNGGFGAIDGVGNCYYNRGFQFNNEIKKFEYDPYYFFTCLKNSSKFS